MNKLLSFLRAIKLSALLLCGTVFFISCEKVIELPLKQSESVLVIEGSINDFFNTQEVLLSRSTAFDYDGDPIPVSGATVTVQENDSRPRTFTEQSPGLYVLPRFRGAVGNTYILKVAVDGQHYQASSTMPYRVIPDSVGTISAAALRETLRSAAVIYTDPPEQKNYYRFKLKVNQVWRKPYWIFNDRFSNGKVVTQTLTDFKDQLEIGDQVELQMQCIDSVMYRYWNDLNGQNPGSSTPANPVSNISNGALGYFSAQSISFTAFDVK